MAIKRKKKKKKGSSLQSQAESLANYKYAAVIADLEGQRSTNRKLYDTSTGQRISALERELGSLGAADATAQARLSGLQTETGNAYQQAMSESQQRNASDLASRNKLNTDLLSSLQAERVARGLSDTVSSNEAVTRLNAQNSAMTATDAASLAALQRMGLMSREHLNNRSASATMMSNTAKSGARGEAQKNLDDAFKAYWTQRLAIQAKQTEAKEEKKGYRTEVYLKLKEQAAAARAAAAQQALQERLAAANIGYKYDALTASTGLGYAKLDSTNAIASARQQFQYDKLKSDNKFRYDSLAAKKAQNQIANGLKAQGFSHRRAMDIANLTLKNNQFQLNVDKFNWSKANPTTGGTKAKNSEIVNGIIASIL